MSKGFRRVLNVEEYGVVSRQHKCMGTGLELITRHAKVKCYTAKGDREYALRRHIRRTTGRNGRLHGGFYEWAEFTLDTASALADLLGVDNITTENAEVSKGIVDAINMDRLLDGAKPKPKSVKAFHRHITLQRTFQRILRNLNATRGNVHGHSDGSVAATR